MAKWTRGLSVGFALVLMVVAAGFGALGASGLLPESHPTASPADSAQIPVGTAVNPPLNAVLTVNRSSLDIPGSFSVQTAATGGNPSPSYVYTYYGMPSGCTTDEAASWSCTPNGAGMFNINVSVSDQNGNVTSSNIVEVTVDSSLTVNLQLSSTSITQGSSLSVMATASGGSGSYSYDYSGLPSGCGGYNTNSFSCNPSSTGQFNIYVNVTDTNGGLATSNNQELSVSSSSGNGNGTGNGNDGSNNSSNPFSSLLSGFSGVLSLLIIAGIIGFATWILLIVGVWIIAVVLIRRLPKRGTTTEGPAALPMTKCAGCSASVPGGSKYCPECGTSTAPKTP
ncbi:MAG: zinc ribbon domain-containing protein [Thermoplasmata archaeon]